MRAGPAVPPAVPLTSRADVPVSSCAVFISYRREEASYLAAWLHEGLSRRLGPDRVFLDVDAIRPGVDFMAAIREGVARSAVLVAVIGSRWLYDERGRRRLDGPSDPVRVEVETALAHAVPIVPVLLGAAVMPRAADLPDSLGPLVRLNAARLHPEHAREDVDRLIASLLALLGDDGASAPAGPPDRPPAPGEGTAATGRRRRRTPPDGDEAERRRFLDQLSAVYTEYLDHALCGEGLVRIPLRLSLEHERTMRPGEQLLPLVRRTPVVLPEGTSIVDVFERLRGLSGAGMLVLGQPGVGKTTLLFEVAAHLARQAARDRATPVPVYLHLLGWTATRTPLVEWLAVQVHRLYRVPPALSRRWVEEGTVLFLLDGLDEIPSAGDRQACVDAVNQLGRFGRRAWVPSVVATREQEYDALDRALLLEGAVLVTAPEPRAVLALLEEAGATTSAVLDAVRREPDLLDLLGSPLLVSMLTLACGGGGPAAEARQGATGFGREQLLGSYVRRRLELERRARGGTNVFPEHRTRQWLTTLAGYLEQHQQTVFLLDSVARDWLPSAGARRLVTATPAVVWAVSFGLVVGLTVDLAGRWDPEYEFPSPVHPALLLAPLGAVVGLGLDVLARARSPVRAATWTAAGTLLALLQQGAPDGDDGLGVALAAVQATLFLAVVGELAVQLVTGDRELGERLSWDWGTCRAALPRRLLLGVVLGLLLSLTNSLGPGGPTAELVVVGLATGLAIGTFFGITSGLRSGLASSRVPSRRTRYEALHRSTLRGLLLGAVATVVTLLLFLLAGLVDSPVAALLRAGAWSLGAGLLWALAGGLAAVLQYGVLRLLLWGFGLAPLRLGRWLDNAVQLRLMYRAAGGGYVFIHRTVQLQLAAQCLPPEPAGTRPGVVASPG